MNKLLFPLKLAAAGLVVYAIVITWPISLVLILVLLVWFFTRRSGSPIGRAIREAALPVLIGIGLFWIVSLVVTLAPQLSDNQWLFEAEQTLLKVRSYVHALCGPNFKIYLLILGLLLALVYFFPESHAIRRLLRTKKLLAHLHLSLLALTSFTFLGARSADEFAKQDQEKRLTRLEISLQTELNAAKKHLATKLANESVSQALSDLSTPNKSRLIYLMKSFRDESPSLMKRFIDDFSRDVENEGAKAQTRESGISNVESYARRLLGPVAESPAERQRQETLAKGEEVLAAKSEERLKELSTGVTEAVMTSLSEALGHIPLDIRDYEIVKEWIKEVIEKVTALLFEPSIERHAESVLEWSRSDSSASRIPDVPEQLRQEVQLTPTAVRRFLFPSFLMDKEPGPSEKGDISEDTVQEIDDRKKHAMEEIKTDESASENPSNPELDTRTENPPSHLRPKEPKPQPRLRPLELKPRTIRPIGLR
jgi:hypothetical protein